MQKLVTLLVGVAIGLAGCGHAPTPTPTPPGPAAIQPLPPGDPAHGEALFRQTVIGKKPEPGCITCHSLAPGVVLVGPALVGVATRSAETIQQLTYTGQATNVADYLQESMIAPNTYIVPGFAPDLMRPTFATELAAQEIADLVAFLLTLKATPVTGKITVLGPMAPVAPAGMPNGAVYFTLQNDTDQPLHLQGATTDVAEALSFHETIDDKGVMRMIAQPDGFLVPAGASLVLEPGNKHLMLENLRIPLVAGAQFTLTLTFTDADPLTLTVPVMAHGAAPMDHAR